jgi:hypothetical protein
LARNQTQHLSLQTARARLAALREKNPRTKAAQIRALWPDIKATLDAGHSLKSVCECLEADGINITVPALGSYITRLRRESGRIAFRMPAPSSVASGQLPRREHDAAQHSGGPNERSNAPFDPLANIRERQGKHTGFDYRPELADPKQLI